MSPLRLSLLAEKILPYTIKPGLLAYEPRTELIAVVSESDDVDIYRQGGQRAIHIQHKDLSGIVTCMQWISEGPANRTRSESKLIRGR